MSQQKVFASERRARLAAERLLQQKQKELFAANAQLSKHALTLTDEIVEKREQVAVERELADQLRGQNDQVKQDLEQANEAVDIAERRLWDSVETIGDGFAVFDAGDVLIAANSAYLSVFDGMEDVTPGIVYSDIVTVLADEGIVDIGDEARANWCRTMVSRWRESQPEICTIKLWNGEFIKLMDRRSENGDTVSLALNITETIRREEQLKDARNNAEAANRAKSAFLAKMSHELRTPMNGVVGMSDLLVESTLDDEQQLYVETIKNSGEALLGLINDVLDFSKMEASKLVLSVEDFDLERVLAEVLMLFQPAIMQKGIELLIDYDMFLPTKFQGDPGRIRQILTNLIGNAVKFTDTGHVLVRVVGLPEGESDNLRIHIAIEDTGPGISENMVDHIFGEFNQVEDEKNRRFEGTGLGLAITKQLIELMGGNIWVDSEIGVGSSFGFYINLKAREKSPDMKPVPEWIKKVVMISQPTQISGVLGKQLRTLGANVSDVTLDNFQSAGIATKGIIIVIDEGQETGRAKLIVDHLAEGGIDVPVVVLQNKGVDVGLKNAENLTVLPKPTDRWALVQAFSDFTPTAVIEPAEALDAKTESNGDIATGEATDILQAVDIAKQNQSESTDPAGGFDLDSNRKMRILAAEDNKTNRLVFSKLVGKLNVDLEFAENGEEAVEKWKSFKPDMIFMDISMPIMDGKQATRAIRKQEGEGSRTPIVALTAHAMDGDDQEILAAGLDHYLTKPLRKAVIFEQIEKAAPRHVDDVF